MYLLTMISVEGKVKLVFTMCIYFLCFSDASKHLVEEMESVSPSELEDAIEKVVDAVEKQPCR